MFINITPFFNISASHKLNFYLEKTSYLLKTSEQHSQFREEIKISQKSFFYLLLKADALKDSLKFYREGFRTLQNHQLLNSL